MDKKPLSAQFHCPDCRRVGHHILGCPGDPTQAMPDTVSAVDQPIKPETRPNGGRTSYYLVHVRHPQREDQPPYQAECEDIIEALRLSFDEANIFKEIWRSANARQGNGKPDHDPLYGAKKIVHYAGRILRRVQRQADADHTAFKHLR